MNYGRLEEVLTKAAEQASAGKGAERHADGQRFEDQPIMWIEREFKSFQLGQAVKKVHESQRLAPEAAARELLGAINYLAAKVIALEATTERVRDKAWEEVARALHGQDLRGTSPAPARGSSVARGEASASVEVTPGSPCGDCHQQFGEYCMRACPFGKKAETNAD